MRNAFLLNYLYICVLSILSQSPSCLTQTANSVASSDGQVRSNVGSTIELNQSQAPLSDGTNQRIQRGQLTDKQATGDIVRQVRRKRELKDAASSIRLRGSPSPSGQTEVASGERRFKKSDHPMDQNLRKLVSKKNNAKINSAAEVSVPEDRQNQDKRDLHRRQGPASRSSLSADEDEAKAGPKETKRSSYSNEAVRAPKPNSKAIKESDLVAESSFAKEKLKLQDNEKYANLSDDSKARGTEESGNEEPEESVEVEENSAEYEETGDDDDDQETPTRNSGYRNNNSEADQLDQGRSSAEDDDSERQDIVKRETEVAEEEYEDIEDQDEACEDANLVDESNFQQAKGRPGPELSEEREKDDSRVKRQDIETSENVLEKNGAPNENEAENQRLKSSEQLGNAKEDSGDNSKVGIGQTALEASSESSLRPQGRYRKRQVALESLEANEPAELEAKRENENTNESSKRSARFQQEVQTDNGEKINSGEQSDVRFDGEKEGSGSPVNEEVKKETKVATETKSDAEDDSKGSNLDATAKSDESNSDFEKKVEEQIQQKIESIKEQIKREVEEKQRIREIEANNAKYDEIQSEIEEDEDEDNQSLDIPRERRSVSKRSIIESIRNPQVKTKRHILKRVKRSDTTDARQLRAIEGVEKLEPDVFAKAQLRHESIRKRSAPIYGAIDKDAADTSKPLMKRSEKPRRVYLVSNERKRSPIPKEREARDTIIIPEQAHVNIEDELPPGLSLDPKLLGDSSSPANYRMKRSPDRFTRRRRASAVIPEGRVAFLGYRPQDDDENDEGSEFDDDGFEDRTSNLQQDKVRAVSHGYLHDQYHDDELGDENPSDFLFAGIDKGREDFLVRRKRAEVRDNDELARLRGGGAVARRQTRARSKQMQNAKITSKKSAMDRDKRQALNGVDDAKSGSVASLVGSSQELSPRLATEYKEAFGGLQSDPGGALARFKRVKRNARRTGSLD